MRDELAMLCNDFIRCRNPHSLGSFSKDEAHRNARHSPYGPVSPSNSYQMNWTLVQWVGPKANSASASLDVESPASQRRCLGWSAGYERSLKATPLLRRYGSTMCRCSTRDAAGREDRCTCAAREGPRARRTAPPFPTGRCLPHRTRCAGNKRFGGANIRIGAIRFCSA
jgi:hypothetical protein